MQLSLDSNNDVITAQDIRVVEEARLSLMNKYYEELDRIDTPERYWSDKTYSTTIRRLTKCKNLKSEEIEFLNKDLIELKTLGALKYKILEPTREEVVKQAMEYYGLSSNTAKEAHDMIMAGLVIREDQKNIREGKADKNRREAHVRPLDNPESDQVQIILGNILKEVKSFDAEKIADIAFENHGIAKEAAKKGYQILMCEDDQDLIF